MEDDDEHSNQEEEDARNAGEGEEEEGGISQYEKHRISRIRENRARLQALGLPRVASFLRAPPSEHPLPDPIADPRSQTKAKRDNDYDDEYQPSDEDRDGEDGRSSSSGPEDEDEEEEEEEEYKRPSTSRRIPKSKGKRKMTSNVAKTRKSPQVVGKVRQQELINDDDAALQQAIALSLGDPIEQPAAGTSGLSCSSKINMADSRAHEKNETMKIQDMTGKRKRRKMNISRVELTEDEVIAYFYSFDEAGKGHITLRDLQRMAIVHNFTWTEMEMAKMIYSFDSDGDGKLNLEDFRRILSRCNMMQKPAWS